jgi:hypothetical protein
MNIELIPTNQTFFGDSGLESPITECSALYLRSFQIRHWCNCHALYFLQFVEKIGLIMLFVV